MRKFVQQTGPHPSKLDRRDAASNLKLPTGSSRQAHVNSAVVPANALHSSSSLTGNGKSRKVKDTYESELDDSTTTLSDAYTQPGEHAQAASRTVQRAAGPRVASTRANFEGRVQESESEDEDDTLEHGGERRYAPTPQVDEPDALLNQISAGVVGFGDRPGLMQTSSVADDNELDEDDSMPVDDGDHANDPAPTRDSNGSYPQTTSGHPSEDESEEPEQQVPPVALKHKAYGQRYHEEQVQPVESVPLLNRNVHRNTHNQELYHQNENSSQRQRATEPMEVKKRKASPDLANVEPQTDIPLRRDINAMRSDGTIHRERSPGPTDMSYVHAVEQQGSHRPRAKPKSVRKGEPARNELQDIPMRPSSASRLQVDEDLLDHIPSQLFAMNFAELQTEGFDSFPPSASSVSGNPEAAKTLDDKMTEMEDGDPAEQLEFFSALTIDDWEKAGVWFTERFATLMQEMQKCRQERRRIAQEFEAEIVKRHEAVTKEKNSLDGALQDMRRGGDTVLHKSTPKRHQRR